MSLTVENVLAAYTAVAPLGGRVWRWFVRRRFKRELVKLGIKVHHAESWLVEMDAKIAQLNANVAKLPRGK